MTHQNSIKWQLYYRPKSRVVRMSLNKNESTGSGILIPSEYTILWIEKKRHILSTSHGALVNLYLIT